MSDPQAGAVPPKRHGHSGLGDLADELKVAAGAVPDGITALRMFPIQRGFPIPWDIIAPFDGICQRNHGRQTLERIAERGGLGVTEAIDVLTAQPYGTCELPLCEAILKLDAIVRERVAARSVVAPRDEDWRVVIAEMIKDDAGPYVNYCWWCNADINGTFADKQPHADGCLYVRAKRALSGGSVVAPRADLRQLLADAYEAGHGDWPTPDQPTRAARREATIDRLLAPRVPRETPDDEETKTDTRVEPLKAGADGQDLARSGHKP